MVNARDIAIAATLAAMYAATVQALHPISFLQFQVRVANALIGLVPIIGIPAVYGLTLGVFLANLTSPLGWIDLLSSIFTFIGLIIVYKLRNVSVILGLTIYSLILGVWVSFMLWYVLGLPYILMLFYVTVGIWIATTVLGYALYQAVKRIIVRL
ncbi:MAG: hypothetical protein DRJ49_00820 [Thermoprotei archaeon]|nr:MAG: hypothetical protein DRJ49_00820 [Thermoprotei archaeon]